MPSALSVLSETGPLSDLCVARGTAIPEFDGYSNDHAEFTKYRNIRWDRDRFLKQQDSFFEVLERHEVRLHFIEPEPDLPWLAYTRDGGFVVGSRVFWCRRRGLPEREGEIDAFRRSLPWIDDKDLVEITADRVEGGDVLVHEGGAFVGVSARSRPDAVAELAQLIEVVPLHLGTEVMHLDTRLTLLPGDAALIYPPAFRADDLEMLRRRFDLVPVTDEECTTLGTNIFVINPETVVVHAGHPRIADVLSARGLQVECVDYSEPIAISGSFRCTTMPLVRGRER